MAIAMVAGPVGGSGITRDGYRAGGGRGGRAQSNPPF